MSEKALSYDQAVLNAYIGANPTQAELVDVIQQSGNYALVDKRAEEIVVDQRAFVLGLLASGQHATSGIAAWFFRRLAEILGGRFVVDQVLRAGTSNARNAFSDPSFEISNKPADKRVVPSRSMVGLLEDAVIFVRRTESKPIFDLAHLVAAFLRQRTAPTAAFRDFGDGFAAVQKNWLQLRVEFYSQLGPALSPGQSAVWAGFLRLQTGNVVSNEQRPLSNEGPDPATTSLDSEKQDEPAANPPSETDQSSKEPTPTQRDTRPVRQDFIPGFSTDRPGIDVGDSLGVDPDVQAFARLICLKDARPPLSIGLFGGWGAGKSTFMERLEKAIDVITHAEALRRENVKAGRAQLQPPGAPEFLARVAHIRFNAWQYSDANLWASLTTEFFDQLRAGGHDRQGNVVHERLVQRVKTHVRALPDDAVEAQQALTDSQRALKEARAERDLALSKVLDAQNGVLTKAAVRKIAEVYDANKRGLSRLGFAVPSGDAEWAVERFTELAKEVREWPGQVNAVLKAAWHYKWKWPVLGAAVVLAASVGIVIWNPGLLPRIVGSLAAFISFAGIVVERLREPFRIVRKIARDTAALGGDLQAVKDDAEKQLLAKQVLVQDKRAEVERRKEKADEVGKTLAAYSGAHGQMQPRLLHFLLNDDPETKEIEGQIGLISRARRLFQAVDEVAAKEREKDNPDEDVPERIVLYIDDLDRCSHDQVYAVLQAVHLLLAFELFVVVVGVDVAWVEEAITRQLRDGPQTQGDDEGKRRKRAIDYLQKIFQIPFWLKPLSTDGNDGGSYGRFIATLAGSDAKIVSPDTERREPTSEEPANTEIQVHLEQPQEGESAPSSFVVVPDEPVEPERLLETVRLDPREVEFLKCPAIGAIAAHDPRGVKRMINTYRLARARMSREELDKLLDADDPTFPILALFAAIETGQPIEEIADVIDRDLRIEKFGAMDFGEFLKARVVEQDKEWRNAIEKKATHEKVTEASALYGRWVAVAEGLAKAQIVRKTHQIFVADCRPIARLVRRYSFSRKQ